MKKFICCILFLSQAYAFSQKVIIEAYGDSLTAGLLDYTNVTGSPELNLVSEILGDFAMFKLTKDRTYLNKHEHQALAWPSLLAKRFESRGVQFEVRNYGLSGARSDSLIDEVRNAQAVGTNDTVIAFFFIGHNDLCHIKGDVNELTQTYFTNFNQAIHEWNEKHRGAKAYFMHVAEVYRIYTLLDQFVWYDQQSRGKYRCNENWDKLFPYCPMFYKKHRERTLEEYLVPRIQSLNSVIKQLAETWRGKSLRNQFFQVEGVDPSKLTTELFALDCYHLSQSGHKFVSDTVYNSVSWQ